MNNGGEGQALLGLQDVAGLLAGIPGLEAIDAISPVNKGWSPDRKFQVHTGDGQQWLLRLADAENYERKGLEFEHLRAVDALGVPMTRPVAFGRGPDGSVYQLLTWVEGTDAETALPTLTEARQYALGRRAGELLRRIHTLPALDGQPPWGERFRRKTESKIERYLACPIHFDGDRAVIDYLRANAGLLDGRPQCFQHGDYHAGNLIVTPQGDIGVIDFNRLDWGDPWEEFNRIVWCAAVSPAFASGRIDGYFADDVPAAFFPLLAYYILSNTLSSVYWAISFGPAEVDTMLRQAADVLHWYDGLRTTVPGWYHQGG